MTAKLNATGLRWVGELSDFNFDIKYRPGRSNTDADSLSRLPGYFEEYMASCTQTISQKELDTSITSIRALGKGEAIWPLPSPQMKTCWVTTGLSFLPMPVVVRSEYLTQHENKTTIKTSNV
jgi:hypothetical protein